MFDALAQFLAWCYEAWPSYAGAIILFSLAVMLVLTPLSVKGTRSMMAMQRLQPEMKRIQQKHKGDKEKMNAEMLAFYQENKINPLGGCLPLLLQMPVFIILYQVLSGLTRRGEDGTFNPKYLEDSTSALAEALRSATEMTSLGMDLSKSPLGALESGVVTALPFMVLVAIVVVTSVIQQRQIQGRGTGSSANPQQQMITKIMPFVFIPITVSIPAGVVIYFAVSNLVRVGQQYLITHLERGPVAPAAGNGQAAAVVEPKQDPDKGGGNGGRAQPAKSSASRPSPSARKRKKRKRRK